MTTLPILQIPFGGRYQSMGTAYTGVVADIGYINANPAGSAIQEYTQLGFFHNNFISDANIDGAVYTLRKDNWGFGAGGQFLYVTFPEYNDWGQRQSIGTYSETVLTGNISYNFFQNTYHDGLVLGANLKAAYRHVPGVMAIITGEVSNQDAIGIMTDIGILSRFDLLKFYNSRDFNFAIGAAIKNLGPFVMGDPLPTEATAGISYSPVRPVTIAYDFIYPISFDPVNFPASSWSMAAGVNVAVTDFLSIQSGANYRGGNPRFSLGTEMIVSNVTITANYTVDLLTQFKNADRLSVEARLNLGDEGRLEKRKKVDKLYLQGLEAFALGELDKAIAIWEEALALDPGNEPVRRSLNNAKDSKKLQQLMDNLQQIE